MKILRFKNWRQLSVHSCFTKNVASFQLKHKWCSLWLSQLFPRYIYFLSFLWNHLCMTDFEHSNGFCLLKLLVVTKEPKTICCRRSLETFLKSWDQLCVSLHVISHLIKLLSWFLHYGTIRITFSGNNAEIVFKFLQFDIWTSIQLDWQSSSNSPLCFNNFIALTTILTLYITKIMELNMRSRGYVTSWNDTHKCTNLAHRCLQTSCWSLRSYSLCKLNW